MAQVDEVVHDRSVALNGDRHLTLPEVHAADATGEYIPHAEVCAFCRRLVEPLTLPEDWIFIR